MAWRFLDIIHRSGVLPDLEQRLRTQPGQKSKLSIKALLLLYFLAAYADDSAAEPTCAPWRTDWTPK